MSKIHIIVAMTKDRIIGLNGHLPWSLPQDLSLFRDLTLGKTVLMGRATYQSIGHPLQQRHNIVISQSLPATTGIELCASFSAGVKRAQTFSKDIFCIGGAEIYKQALVIAEILHISWVENDYSGDCFFPELDLSQWHETDRQHYPGFMHCTYKKKNKKRPVN